MRSLIFHFSFFSKLWRLSLAPMSAGHLIICFWRCISVVSLLLFPPSISVSFIIAGFNWRPLSGDGEKKILSWTKLVQNSWFLLYSRVRGIKSGCWKLWELLSWYVSHYLFPSKKSFSPYPQLLFFHFFFSFCHTSLVRFVAQ